MPAGGEETQNPAAPDDHVQRRAEPLSNKDFRKLLETPRHPGAGAVGGGGETTRGGGFSRRSHGGGAEERRGGAGKGAAGKKKPTTGFHKARKEEEDELTAIMRKYRDRAKERRVGEDKSTEEEMLRVQAGGYRAVAPDVRQNLDAAERRKQTIQESKYLGGDMEHTHLVKGLDYALLQKVRSEIVTKEAEEDEMESAFTVAQKQAPDDQLRKEAETEIKHPLAKNLYRILFKDEPPKTNELFAPRRMAYVMEMEEDNPEAAEIPTTLIRSKADCPVDDASTHNLSTNDMVIQKLSQVLSYLRSDNKKKKKEPAATGATSSEAQKAEPATKAPGVGSESIYEDIGDYVPDRKKDDRKTRKTRGGDRERKKDQRPQSYFDKPTKEEDEGKGKRDEEKRPKEEKPKAAAKSNADAKADRDVFNTQKTGGTAFGATAVDDDSYAECYPGGFASYDAAGESDDEADFSKMDMGSKKGPVKRWDFENEDDYEKYMSSREAMPKAAYQFGVKMADGRKTRKSLGAGEQNKQKIDKQWNQISKILDKKAKEGGPAAKKPKT